MSITQLILYGKQFYNKRIRRRRKRCTTNLSGTNSSSSMTFSPGWALLQKLSRSLLAEFGIIIRQGITAITAFSKRMASGNVTELPNIAQEIIGNLCHQMLALTKRVDWYMRKISAHARSDLRAKRLLSIPGVGPVTASAIVSTIDDGNQFKSGRDLAAWLGLTPLNRSSGGKEKLEKISKRGDRYIRRLLVVGMTARLKTHANTPERSESWIAMLLEDKPSRLATVAMANRTARIIWALLTTEEMYRPRVS